MDVRTAITTQRAVREFTHDPVDDAALERILEAGRRAPSSKNDQPWAFVVIRDRERLERLATVGDYAGHLAGASVAIAFVTGDGLPPAQHASELYDLGHATQNMMLAALELGIGTVHAAVWRQEEVKPLLGLPDDRRCDYLISLGIPARRWLVERPRRTVPRIPLGDLVHHETW